MCVNLLSKHYVGFVTFAVLILEGNEALLFEMSLGSKTYLAIHLLKRSNPLLILLKVNSFYQYDDRLFLNLQIMEQISSS